MPNTARNAPEGDAHRKKRPRHNSPRYDMYTDIRPLRGRTQYTTAYRRLIGLRPLHLRTAQHRRGRPSEGHGITPTGTICTPIFTPFGDAHSTRPLTVGSSGFALFTYGQPNTARNAPEGDAHRKKRPRHNSHRYDMYTDIRPLRGRTQYTTAYRRLIGLRPLHLRLFKEAPFGDRYIAHGMLLRSPLQGQFPIN